MDFRLYSSGLDSRLEELASAGLAIDVELLLATAVALFDPAPADPWIDTSSSSVSSSSAAKRSLTAFRSISIPG